MPSRAAFLPGLLLSACASSTLAAVESPPLPSADLSAAQIVDRYITARGGLTAWHAVQTLSVHGKLDVGTGDSLSRSIAVARQGLGVSVRRAERAAAAEGARKAAEQIQLPFRLEIRRPRKSRLEIDFAGKTAVQVYDGERGWKFRPYLNREDVEPFTADEARSEAGNADLDGPLMDYAAKGTQVTLAGTEAVGGHPAYKLKLTMKNGDVQHVWIDTRNFLDVKLEGAPRRLDGRMHSVFTEQRDFRVVKGLIVPFEYLTSVDGYPGTHRMVFESVTVNSALDDSRFAKPHAPVGASPAPSPGPAPGKSVAKN